MATAMRKAESFHLAGSGRLRLLPVMRGIWLRKAIGQTWRQSPGAITRIAGSTGMASPHHSLSPTPGFSASRAAKPRVTSRVRMRSICHAGLGRADARLV